MNMEIAWIWWAPVTSGLFHPRIYPQGPITDYWIYLAEDMAGKNRSYVGSTKVGVNQLLVPADTVMDTTSYLLVFVAWHLGGIGNSILRISSKPEVIWVS